MHEEIMKSGIYHEMEDQQPNETLQYGKHAYV